LINCIQSNKFRFKKENPNLNSRAKKRSHSSRSLCSILRYQSAEKASVLAPHSTRSLPFIRRGYFYFFRLLFVLLKKAGLSSVEKKQTATSSFGGCSTASHQPQ
jgi:hypothetical protein